MKKFFAAAMVAATLCAGATAAQAQEKTYDYRQVGQWKVVTIYERNKFKLCRAGVNSQAGLIGLLQYANRSWALSFPDLNFTPGTKLSGMLEIGRASQPVSVKAGKPGVRENFKLTGNMLDAMRGGGFMQLHIGGKSWNWQMSDVGQAIGAVQDCHTAALKDGGMAPAAPPNAQGGPTYLGCYVDDPTRALPDLLIAKGATRESCAAAAKRKNYPTMGLQYGGQCYGGGVPGFAKVNDRDCNMRCNSNATQVCGGVWRNSLWKVN